MALSVFAGSFNKNAGTGAQAVTGVGFEPKVLLLWTAYKSTAAELRDSYNFAWGMTTGAAESYSCAVASQGAVATSNRSKRAAAKALTVVEWGETTLAECDLTSFDADGFTLDWTTNAGGTQVVHFLALGGSDITGQKVLTLTSPTVGGNKSYTGVGFEATALILARPVSTAALPVSAAGADFSLSFIDGSGNTAALNVGGDDGVANPDHKTFRTLLGQATNLSNVSATTREAASFVSMNSDGFTLSYSTPNAADLFGCLAIRGPRIKVGLKDLTSGSVTGVGWTPTALLLMAVQDQLLAHRADMRLTVGATTGTTGARNQAAGAIDDRSSSTGGNTNAQAVSTTDQCKIAWDAGPPVTYGDLRLAAFGADGFTLDGGYGAYAAYMAFSDAANAVGYTDQGEEG